MVLGDRIEEICPAWCGPQSPPAHITGGFENNFSSQNMEFLPFSDTLVDIRTTVVMVIPETQTGPLEFKDQVPGEDISLFLYGIRVASMHRKNLLGMHIRFDKPRPIRGNGPGWLRDNMCRRGLINCFYY